VSEPLLLSVCHFDGNLLVVSYHKQEGRYRHVVQYVDRIGSVLSSMSDVFASADEDWPASPPIQQLSQERIEGSETLLGVGQAGKSHWSISVETINDPSRCAIRFDIACRTKMRPQFLGSSYERTDSTSDSIPYRLQLIVDPQSPETTLTGDQANCSFKSTPASGKATYRWAYQIAVMKAY